MVGHVGRAGPGVGCPNPAAHNGAMRSREHTPAAHVVIIGGGPGGYEAALVAAEHGARVSLVEAQGLGGAAVLTDCVPSKTLIATSEAMLAAQAMRSFDAHPTSSPDHPSPGAPALNLAAVNARVRALANAQSSDIRTRLVAEGVQLYDGHARLVGPSQVEISLPDGGRESLKATTILLATGATPRELPTAQPDGQRILTWTQLYGLHELPEHLIVVGSGVTGAEFASAYQALGSAVTLISSRDQVLPGKDKDAAAVLEQVFSTRALQVLARRRAVAVHAEADGVQVKLGDGSVVQGSHCLMAVGSVPATSGLGLEQAGVARDEHGSIRVDKVSRTNVAGIYAAGDCTGVLPLASVAAMQGRIAMRHLLGDSVEPLDLSSVASTVFTAPEIASVGVSQEQIERGEVAAHTVSLPLARNARAKMQGIHEGFVKLFTTAGTGLVLGGVVVAPNASELIYPIALAVKLSLHASQLSAAFTVYPSLTGSLAEAARQSHG